MGGAADVIGDRGGSAARPPWPACVTRHWLQPGGSEVTAPAALFPVTCGLPSRCFQRPQTDNISWLLPHNVRNQAIHQICSSHLIDKPIDSSRPTITIERRPFAPIAPVVRIPRTATRNTSLFFNELSSHQPSASHRTPSRIAPSYKPLTSSSVLRRGRLQGPQADSRGGLFPCHRSHPSTTLTNSSIRPQPLNLPKS